LLPCVLHNFVLDLIRHLCCRVGRFMRLWGSSLSICLNSCVYWFFSPLIKINVNCKICLLDSKFLFWNFSVGLYAITSYV
jgi:hypothetical protein